MIDREGEFERNRLYRSANMANSPINNICIPRVKQKFVSY